MPNHKSTQQNMTVRAIFKRKLLFTLLAFLLLFPFADSFAQLKDSTSSFKISGYVDAYFAYYTDSTGVNSYQKFPVVSPRHNVFGLNIIQLTGQYTSEKLRATATLHFGDIPASAWSPVFNMIQEANMGIRLNKKVWLDVGFFKTHIGTEALLPKDNIASTLSIITVYEPWFQSGIKLTYNPNDKLTFCFHVLNGYNTFVETNKSKAIGITFQYLLGEKGSIGYYNLIGDETPDQIKTTHLRFLNNLVFTYAFNKKFKILTGVDYISQQHSAITDSTQTASIYSAILTLRYQLRTRLGIYVRGEMFRDSEGFLTDRIVDANRKVTGLGLTGETIGLEYKLYDNMYIRLEGRQLQMDKDQKIFRTNGKNTNERLEVMLHAGVWF